MVARLNHLGRAAEELGISQPTLSRTIRTLESRYQSPLFERRGRTVRLNDNGRALLPFVERALQNVEDADRAMRDRGTEANAKVTVGFVGTLGSRTIPTIVRAFHVSDSAIGVHLFQGAQPDLLERLRDGRLDIALTSAGAADATFAWHPLWDEELFVQVYAKHRFVTRAALALDELKEEPLVALRTGTALRAATDAFFAEAGVEPNIVCEGQNGMTARGLVAAGLGIMLGPLLEDERADGVVSIPVTWPRCTRPVGLSWLEDRYLSLSTQRFRDAVIRARAQLRPASPPTADLSRPPQA
jgi:DNA-binding transcriptional LysR family regulator